MLDNSQLKFSWGHIIAFLALIFICYVSYMGVVYLSDGSFTIAAIVMAAVGVLLLCLFMGVQAAKSAKQRFRRTIRVERALVFASPVLFLALMVPYMHFWTVHSKEAEIIGSFEGAVDSSKELFERYEKYTDQRKSDYSERLQSAINGKEGAPSMSALGLHSGRAAKEKDFMVNTLYLQLRSGNYDKLKTAAEKWISNATNGTTTWNVFLLGNSKQVSDAIDSWYKQLCEFSNPVLSNEGVDVKSFSDTKGRKIVNNAIADLQDVRDSYTSVSFPSLTAIITLLIMYFMLMIPYMLQPRHTKSMMRLFGREKGTVDEDTDFYVAEDAANINTGSGDKLVNKAIDNIDIGAFDDEEPSMRRRTPRRRPAQAAPVPTKPISTATRKKPVRKNSAKANDDDGFDSFSI